MRCCTAPKLSGLRRVSACLRVPWALIGWLLVPAFVAATPSPGARVPTPEELALAATVRRLLNDARQEAGLPALQAARTLDVLAYQHSVEMAAQGQVTHYSQRLGISTATRVHLAFPGILQFAENVARNRDPQHVHEALMRSPGHRANRLDPSFTHVGVGIARDGPHQIYVTELFVRAPNPLLLAQIHRLYTQVPPEQLPAEQPRHGLISAEMVSIGAPTPENPEYWTRQGIDAYDAGRYGEAIRRFRTALRLDPGYAQARFDLARALIGAGRVDEAESILREILAADPDDLDARASLGSVLLLRQQYGPAEQAFRELLRHRTRDAGAWYNLGLALEYQNRLEQAANAYAQALHLQPDLSAAAAGLERVRHRRRP